MNHCFFSRRMPAASALVLALAACAAPGGTNPANQITLAQIAKVERGMTPDQVRAALGAPASVGRIGRNNEEVWTYKYIDRAQFTPHMELYVYFDPATKSVRHSESGFDKSYDPGGQ